MSGFRYADGRPMWDRQTGETGEQFDWFRHWLNDDHRRSHPRVAERFDVPVTRVAAAARRNRWTERAAAHRAHNSVELRRRFNEITESTLVPFAGALRRLAAHAVTAAPLQKVTADRAVLALTAGLKTISDPAVMALIRDDAAQGAANREIDALDLVLDVLAANHPEAHDAVLEAIGAVVDDGGDPAAAGG